MSYRNDSPLPEAGPLYEPTTTRISISGMTCHACEVRVGKALRTLPGVTDVSVSAALGRAVIETDAPASRAAFVAVIEKLGYSATAPRWLSRDRGVWSTVVSAAILLGGVGYLVIHFGLLGLAPAAGTHAGVFVALLVGLAAGVSTCMALVGGLLLALSAAHAAGSPDAVDTWVGRLRPQLMFHTGRIAFFAIGGALLGGIGSTIPMPPSVLGTGVLIAAFVMIVLGVRLTGVSPRIAGWTPTLPGRLGKWLNRNGAGSYTDSRAAIAGAGTFLMPCGFTQAMQILAVSTGSPVRASMIMVLFAIGTLPGLLGLGLAAGVAGSRQGTTALRIVGVVVMGFALINVNGAIRSLGFDLSFGSGVSATSISSNVAVSGGVQTVTMTQQTQGYEPADTVVYAGLPIRWVINATDPYSCSSALRMPSVGISVNMTPGQNTIKVPALAAGTTTFTCVMGMYSGHLRAIPQPMPGPSS